MKKCAVFLLALSGFFYGEVIYCMEIDMDEMEQNIKSHVVKLSHEIGERNYMNHKNLEMSADYIRESFRSYGYQTEDEVYMYEGRKYRNIIAVKAGYGKPKEIILIGAHYDSVWGSPGADDNASGTSGLLVLAQLLARENIYRTVKFVAFTNEEPPFFLGRHMGSRVYAKAARERGEDIIAMLCLESIGYFSEEQNSQEYPPIYGLFYPDKANFIAVVGNLRSRSLVKKVSQLFRKHSAFPLESVSAVSIVPGISFSDHDSFWREGYKAVMITDTAFYRNPYYHTMYDTYDKLDYRKLAEVVKGLYYSLLELVR